MATDERQALLLRAIDRLQGEHADWIDNDSREITPTFRQSIEDVVELFDEGDIPGPLRRLERAVFEFAGHWKRFVDDEALNAQAILPGQGFWKSLEYVETLRHESTRPSTVYLESIEQLTDQKVPDRQICLIYGFLDANGAPDFRKLHEEREIPGTHTNRDEGWMPPQERAAMDRQEKRDEIFDRLKGRQVEKMAAIVQPAPPASETVEDLLRQRVSAKQIAAMKNITLEEVFQAAAALDLEVQENYSLTPKKDEPEKKKPGRPKGSFKKKPQEESAGVAVADDDEPAEESPVAQIMQHHADGFDAATIAEALSDDRRRWTEAEVAGIIAGSQGGGNG